MSLPPRVLLHVGMAKAGSTALQNVMAENHAALLAQGVLFPLSILRRSNPLDPARTPGHLDLIRQIDGPEPSPLFAECAAAPAAHTLFLSIENLFNIESDANVEKLAGFLAGRATTLLAVLRAPQDWVASRYGDLVTGGLMNETRPVARFLEETLASGALDYARRLDFLATAFRAEAVVALDHADLGPGRASIVAAALEALGATLPPEALAERRVNVSRPYPEAIEAHRRLNPLVRGLPPPRRFAVAAAMKAIAARRAAEGLIRPGPAPIPVPLRRALVAATAEPCRAVAARWLGGRPFGPEPAWAEAAPPPLDAAATAAIEAEGFEALLGEAEAAACAGEKIGAELASRPEEARRLRAACAEARVVLDYGAGLATWLAAGLPGKLVFGVEDDRDRAMRLQIRLDAAAPPSPAVVRHVDLAGAAEPARRYAEAVWEEPFFRHPDLVVVAGRFRAACLAATAARAARPVRVLFDDYARRAERPDLAALPQPERLVGRMAEFRLAPAAAASAPAAAASARAAGRRG